MSGLRVKVIALPANEIEFNSNGGLNGETTRVCWGELEGYGQSGLCSISYFNGYFYSLYILHYKVITAVVIFYDLNCFNRVILDSRYQLFQ